MRQQLTDLRRAMTERGVDMTVIPSADYHGSEYVGDFFKCRAYVSGFTGSAGTLVVTAGWAGLWTDGRYFLQAAQQLAGSGIELCKMGEPGVPTVEEWIKSHIRAGMTLAFDGRVVSAKWYREMQDVCAGIGAKIETGLDLPGAVWPDRPALSTAPVFELPEAMAGRSRADKLSDLRAAIRAEGADALVLSSLTDICWLLNIRGGDVACTPVVLSYLLVTADAAQLYIHEETLSGDIRARLAADGVSFRPYGAVYDDTAALPAGTRLMMSLAQVNAALLSAVPAGVEILDRPNPTEKPKALKNEREVANMRECHRKDGVAVTKLIYWLKQQAGKEPMDEISVAEKLEGFRREQEGYIGPSFEPIIAYGPHGAIIHYSATEETNAAVEPRSFLLADTGGHYWEGTTDITRTIAMGPLTDEEKRMYTLVLKGHLALGAARFRHGCTGQNLDYVAHAPLWAIGLDYNHGTGHGVGYVLSVHEGPQNFRWRGLPGTQPAVLEPGMITSDEPGIYLEGRFGVRLENLTVVCEDGTNEYGRFLHLEYLTMVPFDRDAIDPALLNEDEKRWLNDYHRQVFAAIAPRLSPAEAAWLEEATRPL